MQYVKLVVDGQPPKATEAKESTSTKFKNISLGIAGVISSILIPIVGYLFTQKANNKEIEKSYIELGVKILSQEPKPGSENIRLWAVKLINEHSAVKLDSNTKSDLIKNEAIFSSSSSKLNPDTVLSLKAQYKFASNKPLGFTVFSHQPFWDSASIVKANIKFVFIKATQGQNAVDMACSKNVALAKKYKLPYSIYHFFDKDASVALQADNFNAAYEKNGSSLPPMIDLEWAPYNREIKNKVAYVDSVLKFIGLLKYPDKENIIIYTAPGFARDYMDNRLGRYKLFIAGYNKNFNPSNGIPGIWKTADYWDFTSTDFGELVIANK